MSAQFFFAPHQPGGADICREAAAPGVSRLPAHSPLESSSFGHLFLRSRTLKRILDNIVAVSLVLFTLPLMVMIALAIKCDSPGPIFYRQTRVGLNGRHFEILKFRSMVEQAEGDGRPTYACQGDPRVTRIGRLIRITRMDELPQLFNVLRGDMSMVGPRPERPYFVDSFSKFIPLYAERHSVKPGITGWAQINYRYSASLAEARVKHVYDLHYVNNFSAFLDLKILLATVGVVVRCDGAR